MYTISATRIAKELEPYGLNANEILCSQIRSYIEILLAWNRKMSLTAITDPVEIVHFHFGESIFALTVGAVSDGRLADVGSGAGFPGLPIRLARPSVNLTMIESNIKKCTFLREVSRKLGVEGVRVLNSRMEDLPSPSADERFDFISARAVGDFEVLLHFATKFLTKEGRLVLWIGQEDSETLAAAHSVCWEWSDPILIPNSSKRNLLSGRLR
jgi:16S rRNA (guanine(527)-N(7))-methyltransferase RsmG